MYNSMTEYIVHDPWIKTISSCNNVAMLKSGYLYIESIDAVYISTQGVTS